VNEDARLHATFANPDSLIDFVSIPAPADVLLTIYAEVGAEPLVRIRRNGAVEYGPNVDLDATARTFWAAISDSIPGPLRGCPDPDAHRRSS
jgi:hypothetical protein